MKGGQIKVQKATAGKNLIKFINKNKKSRRLEYEWKNKENAIGSFNNIVCNGWFVLPVDVVAATLPKAETQYSSFDNVVGENPEESKIVKELTNERTENSKEFLLEDGTKMIAQYNEPVHYKDSKGKWVEYNNTLSEDKTASPDEVGDSSYTNKSSDISVNLSNKAKSKNMISLQSNGYKISWGYDNAGKSKADVKKNNEKTSGNDKFTMLSFIQSAEHFLSQLILRLQLLSKVSLHFMRMLTAQ